jgi:hypothetical protein
MSLSDIETQMHGHQTPPLLEKLVMFAEQQGGDFAGDFAFANFVGEDGAELYFAGPIEAAQKLAIFGEDRGGGMYGFWLLDDRSPADAPVVYLCPDGARNGVMAADFGGFLSLLALDLDQLGAEYDSQTHIGSDDEDAPQLEVSHVAESAAEPLPEDAWRPEVRPSEDEDEDADDGEELADDSADSLEPQSTAGHAAFMHWLRDQEIEPAVDALKAVEQGRQSFPDFHDWLEQRLLCAAVAEAFSGSPYEDAFSCTGPHLLRAPEQAWRSRVEGDRWEVNAAHPDFVQHQDVDDEVLFRYLVLLRAKEIVERTGEPSIERMIEVLGPTLRL